jgi:hypothetical protein
MRPWGSAVLAAGLLLCSAAHAEETAWWKSPSPCPDNARLRGTPPPKGREVGCKKPSGVWHGRRTVWFDKCKGEVRCVRGQLPKRYEGEYRRGVEHGQWTWWRPDGSKGLEGQYHAGRKSGVWLAWDATGAERRTEFPVFASDEKETDRAIEAALAAASAAGNRELARELATRELSRGTPADEAPLTTKGRTPGSADSIRTGATFAGETNEVPNEDLGRTEFSEGGTEELPPYVHRAIRLATGKVDQCFAALRRKQAGARGEVVARFYIPREGRASDVRLVKSTMPESFNECLRAELGQIDFGQHDSETPFEVISPWKLEPS